jgi:hypothetical protein
MNGTARNAPPVPTIPATSPISVPIENNANRPGSSRVGCGTTLRIICHDVSHVKLPKIAAIGRIGSALAICAPTSEPSTSPGAIATTIGHDTAPRLWCARAEANAVNTIDAADVPIASGSRWSLRTPSCVNTSTSTGTIVKPPPMPSSPARKPTNAPSARKIGISARFTLTSASPWRASALPSIRRRSPA